MVMGGSLKTSYRCCASFCISAFEDAHMLLGISLGIGILIVGLLRLAIAGLV